jgi:hypothetical protein
VVPIPSDGVLEDERAAVLIALSNPERAFFLEDTFT